MNAILAFFTPFVVLFGACIGSFLSVCIYRIPRDESIVKPRSHCPTCGKLIPWYFNIPVLSWLMLGGKCHYCKARISPRYLILEVFTALLFTVVWLQVLSGMMMTDDELQLWMAHGGDLIAPPSHAPLGLTPLPAWTLLPAYWLVLWGLILGTFVDLEHYIIPDRVTIGGIVVGVVISALVPELHFTLSWKTSLVRSLVGLAAGFGGLWLVAILGELAFKKEAMGFGDVKLMGAIGAFFGWKAVIFVLLAASLFGSVVGVTLIALRKRQLQGRIPFGPFLALGTLLWMFWGRAITTAYMRFLMPPMV
jgi:leader peptidase (prepilin peptidase)/N-methyltransferase